MDVDRLPPRCPDRVPKATKVMYDALRRKYGGKRREERRAGSRVEADPGKLAEGEALAEEDETGSGSPSEAAEKNIPQMLQSQNQEDFSIKKMDQLKPYIYTKSVRVETLIEKALQR